MGLGTEGLPALGHRQRLFARAMYLEDAAGERVAMVALDLGESSVVLHRRVAAMLHDSIGLGADRLLLSATHTHSGPSHYFGMPGYDELGSTVAAYDAVLVDTLSARITTAVLDAYRGRQRARAAWGLTPVWGYTHIRSLPAYRRNVGIARAALRSRFAPDPTLAPELAGVDPTLGMLRVDVWDSAAARFRRAGAFTTFAIHSTAFTSGERLYDADIHGRVAALMEQYVDSGGAPWAPRAVSLFVNGGEGDVAPELDEAAQCPTPRLVRTGAPRGPRGTSFETTWEIIPRDSSRERPCLSVAKRELERIARGIFGESRALYERLEQRLAESLPIETAFTVLHVGNDEQGDGQSLCSPSAGVALVLGADPGWTRLRWDWRLLMVDSVTYRPLPATPKLAGTTKCQGRKRRLFGPLQSLLAGPHSLPRDVQLSLVRLGPVALAFIPGEPTTHSAWTLRRAAATALFGERSSADSVLVVPLTNGYIQYVATADEYPLQLYEGAATIYGPRELATLTTALRGMAERMTKHQPARSIDSVDSVAFVSAWYTKAKPVTRWNELPNPSTATQPWRDLKVTAGMTSIRVGWTGPSPSAFYTSNGPSVFFEQRAGNLWRPVAWDNLPEVEVEITRQADGFARYLATWRPAVFPTEDVRIRLTYHGLQTCRQLLSEAAAAC